MEQQSLQQILFIIPGALLGLTMHEAAHAFVAWRLGDPTAKQLGRLTLNPLKHLSLFGTLMVFIIHFGWAKPVPVNPRHFSKPKRDMLLVALAGPATNLILAAGFGLSMRFFTDPTGVSYVGTLIYQMIVYGLIINTTLAVFNLIPVPPLDGSRIVHFFFPAKYERQYRMFERIAAFFLLGIILAGMLTETSVIGGIIDTPVRFLVNLFASL